MFPTAGRRGERTTSSQRWSGQPSVAATPLSLGSAPQGHGAVRHRHSYSSHSHSGSHTTAPSHQSSQERRTTTSSHATHPYEGITYTRTSHHERAPSSARESIGSSSNRDHTPTVRRHTMANSVERHGMTPRQEPAPGTVPARGRSQAPPERDGTEDHSASSARSRSSAKSRAFAMLAAALEKREISALEEAMRAVEKATNGMLDPRLSNAKLEMQRWLNLTQELRTELKTSMNNKDPQRIQGTLEKIEGDPVQAEYLQTDVALARDLMAKQRTAIAILPPVLKSSNTQTLQKYLTDHGDVVPESVLKAVRLECRRAKSQEVQMEWRQIEWEVKERPLTVGVETLLKLLESSSDFPELKGLAASVGEALQSVHKQQTLHRQIRGVSQDPGLMHPEDVNALFEQAEAYSALHQDVADASAKLIEHSELLLARRREEEVAQNSAEAAKRRENSKRAVATYAAALRSDDGPKDHPAPTMRNEARERVDILDSPTSAPPPPAVAPPSPRQVPPCPPTTEVNRVIAAHSTPGGYHYAAQGLLGSPAHPADPHSYVPTEQSVERAHSPESRDAASVDRTYETAHPLPPPSMPPQDPHSAAYVQKAVGELAEGAILPQPTPLSAEAVAGIESAHSRTGEMGGRSGIRVGRREVGRGADSPGGISLGDSDSTCSHISLNRISFVDANYASSDDQREVPGAIYYPDQSQEAEYQQQHHGYEQPSQNDTSFQGYGGEHAGGPQPTHHQPMVIEVTAIGLDAKKKDSLVNQLKRMVRHPHTELEVQASRSQQGPEETMDVLVQISFNPSHILEASETLIRSASSTPFILTGLGVQTIRFPNGMQLEAPRFMPPEPFA